MLWDFRGPVGGLILPDAQPDSMQTSVLSPTPGAVASQHKHSAFHGNHRSSPLGAPQLWTPRKVALAAVIRKLARPLPL